MSIVSLSSMTAMAVEELTKRLRSPDTLRAKQAMAKIKQQNIAAAHGHIAKAKEGLGRLRMVVNDDTFHYWGQRLGYQCWSDKQFLKEMERDNPELRIKSEGTKLTVGGTSLRKTVAKYA